MDKTLAELIQAAARVDVTPLVMLLDRLGALAPEHQTLAARLQTTMDGIMKLAMQESQRTPRPTVMAETVSLELPRMEQLPAAVIETPEQEEAAAEQFRRMRNGFRAKE